jgi:hypothetical protein
MRQDRPGARIPQVTGLASQSPIHPQRTGPTPSPPECRPDGLRPLSLHGQQVSHRDPTRRLENSVKFRNDPINAP